MYLFSLIRRSPLNPFTPTRAVTIPFPLFGVQLLFPVLMLLMVWRTIAVRVRPNDLLVFRVRDTDNQVEENNGAAVQEQRNDGEPPEESTEAEDGEVRSSNSSNGVETQTRRGLWTKVGVGA